MRLADLEVHGRRFWREADQDRPEVNFTLIVGQLSEEVVVTAKAALLETQTADMGYAVDQRQVTDLPLLGRRYA